MSCSAYPDKDDIVDHLQESSEEVQEIDIERLWCQDDPVLEHNIKNFQTVKIVRPTLTASCLTLSSARMTALRTRRTMPPQRRNWEAPFLQSAGSLERHLLLVTHPTTTSDIAYILSVPITTMAIPRNIQMMEPINCPMPAQASITIENSLIFDCYLLLISEIFPDQQFSRVSVSMSERLQSHTNHTFKINSIITTPTLLKQNHSSILQCQHWTGEKIYNYLTKREQHNLKALERLSIVPMKHMLLAGTEVMEL